MRRGQRRSIVAVVLSNMARHVDEHGAHMGIGHFIEYLLGLPLATDQARAAQGRAQRRERIVGLVEKGDADVRAHPRGAAGEQMAGHAQAPVGGIEPPRDGEGERAGGAGVRKAAAAPDPGAPGAPSPLTLLPMARSARPQYCQ